MSSILETQKAADKLIDALKGIADYPQGIRETSNYVFMVSLINTLTEKGMDRDQAESLVTKMEVDLPSEYWTEAPNSFDELVDVFASVLLRVKSVVDEDFQDSAKVLENLSKQMYVKIG